MYSKPFLMKLFHRWYHFGEQYCLPEAPCVACLVLWCCQTRVNACFNACLLVTHCPFALDRDAIYDYYGYCGSTYYVLNLIPWLKKL
jgi:hypothetical protein